jgi:2-desacetyl-2-hydroxyethyl bacteriochlorophyllide A dehydrogenase
MRAVRNSPPTVAVVDVDEPDGEGQLVRIASVGICASDLNYLDWGSTQIAGHEFAGVLSDGTAVAVEAIFGCAACPECEQGNYNHCERGVQGLGITDPGGMCEWFRAPGHALVELPRGLDVNDASLVEPASVALHACHLADVDPHTRVAIVGAGAIGLLTAAASQSLGAPEVAVLARHRHQHEAREQLGAEAPGSGYDVVIETAGSQSGLDTAVDLARPRGTIVHLGYFSDIKWPMQEAFRKELALKASLGYAAHAGRREFAEAAELLAARPELPEVMITHRFSIEDAPEAFRQARDRSRGAIRVVVEP